MRRVSLLLAALLALGVAGCGSSSSSSSSTDDSTTAAQQQPSRQQTVPAVPPLSGQVTPDPDDLHDLRNPISVPKGVPTEATKAATRDQSSVLTKWTSALTAADFKTAAAQFADGTKVRNGDPVIHTLFTSRDRLLFNMSFPCGAEVSDVRDAGNGYLIVKFVLTDRRYSKCQGAGDPAASVVHVKDGVMDQWYRLPDPPAPDTPSSLV